LRDEPDQSPVKLPANAFLKKARLNVPIAQDRNTFQIIENLQKVLGRDISYAKRVPPIGAPKATLTPAEAPAAARHLLFSSF
jgi:hypothetical protein